MSDESTIYSRNDLAQHILGRLESEKPNLIKQWQNSADQIRYFYLDDIFPEEVAREIYNAFPVNTENLTLKKSLRELKFVSAQMDQHHPLLEESIYAFQNPSIVRLIEEITKLKMLEPDELLYAGGISLMARGHFLNPHLDNSHDKFRQRYRVLNLLYYATPDWNVRNGGNLELWPEGTRAKPITITSKFNRLVVMITTTKSWHSVSPIVADRLRCCVSNYYFSKSSPEEYDYFHVTSFRGRPEQKLRDLILRADIKLRMAVRKLFPGGIVKNKHFYAKE